MLFIARLSHWHLRWIKQSESIQSTGLDIQYTMKQDQDCRSLEPSRNLRNIDLKHETQEIRQKLHIRILLAASYTFEYGPQSLIIDPVNFVNYLVLCSPITCVQNSSFQYYNQCYCYYFLFRKNRRTERKSKGGIPKEKN